MTPKKAVVGLKWKEKVNKEGLELSLMEMHQKRGFTFARIENQCSSRLRAPCVSSEATGTEGEDNQKARSSAQR